MIFAFQTKLATKGFIEAFCNNSGYPVRYFSSREDTGGEEFYNYSWPDFHGRIVEENEICFQGLIRGTERLKPFLKTHRFYYFDQPYFFYTHYRTHPKFNNAWMRICVNDVQQNKIDTDPKHEQRYKNLYDTAPEEIELLDWRKNGDHILVIPPSYHTARWYGIDEKLWTNFIVEEIKKHTDRPIVVRYKFVDGVKWGERVDTHRPLSEDLKNCWAMVSFHSMCASHAIRRGIPSFCTEYSPAAPVSLSLDKINNIEKPLMHDREQWIYSLLGSQFMLSEMQSGFAYEYLKDKK